MKVFLIKNVHPNVFMQSKAQAQNSKFVINAAAAPRSLNHDYESERLLIFLVKENIIYNLLN